MQSIVSEACICFALMYMTDHIFLVLPIKDMINEFGDLTTPFKLATGTKPSVSHLRVLFFHMLYRGTKALDMRHQAQKGFRGIFVGITQIKKDIFCMYRVQGR